MELFYQNLYSLQYIGACFSYNSYSETFLNEKKYNTLGTFSSPDFKELAGFILSKRAYVNSSCLRKPYVQVIFSFLLTSLLLVHYAVNYICETWHLWAQNPFELLPAPTPYTFFRAEMKPQFTVKSQVSMVYCRGGPICLILCT